jgi:ParB-like chromosome segregation protein Spo0J
MSYFHSVIDRGDVTDEFVADIKKRGVQTPIEIVTDGKKAAIADGHHRTLSASVAGVKSVPVVIYRVSPEAMMGGRGDVIRETLRKKLKPRR